MVKEDKRELTSSCNLEDLRIYRTNLSEYIGVFPIITDRGSPDRSGRSSSYGIAARSISEVKERLSTIKGELRNLRGVGETTEKIIAEILKTRSSSYFESLLSDRLN